MSFTLVLVFQRGLFAGRSDEGVDDRACRVGVLAKVRAIVGSKYVGGNALRTTLPETSGILEYRRLGGTDDFVVEVLGWRDARPAGVTVP